MVSYFKKGKKFFIWGIVLAALVVFCYVQNNLLTVSHYLFHSDKITEELNGYTIVLISDLHNKCFGTDQGKLLKRTEECAPDLIVITGDLIDSTYTDLDKAMRFVRGAVKIAPVYYVTGNHEYMADDGVFPELMERLRSAGVLLLLDDVSDVTVGESGFRVIGLDDNSLQDGTLQNLMRDADGGLTVLLAHEPQYLERYSAQNADLVLAGHAHGGQFRLPFAGGGLIAPGQGFFPKYTAGIYTEGKTMMIVSRGLGNSVIPLRLFNYPDIVCIRFVAE